MDVEHLLPQPLWVQETRIGEASTPVSRLSFVYGSRRRLDCFSLRVLLRDAAEQATHFSRHGRCRAERLEARLLQSRRQELREQFGLHQGNFCGRPHHVNRGLDGFKILENDLHDAIIDEAAVLPEGREPDSQLARYCSVGRSRTIRSCRTCAGDSELAADRGGAREAYRPGCSPVSVSIRADHHPEFRAARSGL